MKALTEFSGTVIRMAANAFAEAKAKLPATPAPAEGETAAVESDETKAAIEAALTAATGISGDRVARLREALTVVGAKTADVRLVRVFAGETAPAGAKTAGEHHFLIEAMPQSMKPNYAAPEKERGGRGGRGQGGGRPAEGGATTGGFSMDAAKADRAGQKRGGPGGGRGGPKA